MTDRSTDLQHAAEYLVHAPQQDSIAGVAAFAQMAQAHATIAVAKELSALREAVGKLRRSVLDQGGYSSADHLRAISEWAERIANK
ncbi:hypothetical protein [Micromonospora sp. C41]|uniref:hypothetical protein n=1 Tax=Micromonospora sp. C41 TaxID=2824878 RepID=UPI001B384456|nr:hypothetical protein [Micromonospora sp. C41]MBQ1060063.1 hypothetical protein [Micromonospora sp. C41]